MEKQYCSQCSLKRRGRDTGDFKGEITEAQGKAGQLVHVECAGCGPIMVNHLGERCILDHLNRPRKVLTDSA